MDLLFEENDQFVDRNPHDLKIQKNKFVKMSISIVNSLQIFLLKIWNIYG